MDDDDLALGTRKRREVLGNRHVDEASERTTPFTAAFEEYITRAAWGQVWARPGLDRRTRRLVTIALLTAIGAEPELALHIRAALDDGIEAEQIAEVLLHTGVYAGVPRANRGFAIGRAVLDDR